MSFVTYETLLASVKRQIDIEDEDFFQTAELMDYCNQAIRQAESIILGLYEDYFLDSAAVSLVSGTATVDLPTDIYADKIRSIIYANGSINYEVRRLRASAFREIPNVQSGERYTYLITNDATTGRKVNLYPTPAESGSYLTVWYLRNAKVVTLTTDTIDIPEFRSFIEKYMIVKCLQKEGSPLLQAAALALEDEKRLMIDSLSERIPDNDNTVEGDFDHYMEHN